MQNYLPSEIGRLIYGYLETHCGEDLANEFLNTCDVMKECRIMKQEYSRKFHTKIQDLALEDKLNRYSILCSRIFQNTEDEPIHYNILQLLKNILDSSKETNKNLNSELNNLNESNKVFGISNKQNCKTDSIPINRNIVRPDSMNLRSKTRANIENNSYSSKVELKNNTVKKTKDVKKTKLSESEKIFESIAKNCHYKVNHVTPKKVQKDSSNEIELSVDKTVLMSPFSKIFITPTKLQSKLFQDKDKIMNNISIDNQNESLVCSKLINRSSSKTEKHVNEVLRKEKNNCDHQTASQSLPENESNSDKLPWDHKMRKFVPTPVKLTDSEEKNKSGEDSKLKKKKEPIRKRKRSDEIAELKKKKKFEVQEEKLLNSVPKESISSENVDKSKTGLATSRRRRKTKDNINEETHNISNDTNFEIQKEGLINSVPEENINSEIVFINNNQRFENVEKNLDTVKDMNVINNTDKINYESEKMIVTLEFSPNIMIYSRS